MTLGKTFRTLKQDTNISSGGNPTESDINSDLNASNSVIQKLLNTCTTNVQIENMDADRTDAQGPVL